MNATGVRLPDDFVVGSYESKSPASISASPLYTPRSSIRHPSPDLGDFVFSMEVDETVDETTDKTVVVNGRYFGMQMPRPPLRRQIAMSLPREYYDSLAMVLPLQHVQIEHELAQAAHDVDRKVAFQAAIRRAHRLHDATDLTSFLFNCGFQFSLGVARQNFIPLRGLRVVFQMAHVVKQVPNAHAFGFDQGHGDHVLADV